MATYAKATYKAAKYAAIRPTYPRQLFDFVFRYHERGAKAQFDMAVDVGCGPGELRSFYSLSCWDFNSWNAVGQATLELTPFRKIIGVDPSSTMIEQAQDNMDPAFRGQVEYRQSSAESIPFLEDRSVDIITSGALRLPFTS